MLCGVLQGISRFCWFRLVHHTLARICTNNGRPKHRQMCQNYRHSSQYVILFIYKIQQNLYFKIINRKVARYFWDFGVQKSVEIWQFLDKFGSISGSKSHFLVVPECSTWFGTTLVNTL